MPKTGEHTVKVSADLGPLAAQLRDAADALDPPEPVVEVPPSAPAPPPRWTVTVNGTVVAVEHDDEANATYITLVPHDTVACTVPYPKGINLDYGDGGELVGVEVLHAAADRPDTGDGLTRLRAWAQDYADDCELTNDFERGLRAAYLAVVRKIDSGAFGTVTAGPPMTAAEKVAEALARDAVGPGTDPDLWMPEAVTACRALGVDPDSPDNPVKAETERCADVVETVALNLHNNHDVIEAQGAWAAAAAIRGGTDG